LRFVVTIPIHMGAMKVRRKVRRGNSFSSETTAISSGTGSGTHPHKVLGQAKRQRRARGHPYIKQKHTRIRFKCDFCEKTTKTALKNELNIDLGNILFVYLRDVKWNDQDKKSVKIDRNSQLESFSRR
jgi:hypothetical protein